jgi:hypothetical protein
MAKFNVFDENNKYLGTIHGIDKEDALAEAIEFGMISADHCEEREEIIFRDAEHERQK